MKYKLVGYRYNDNEQEMARFEQVFETEVLLQDKLKIIQPMFENYEIYKDDELIKTNFRRGNNVNRGQFE